MDRQDILLAALSTADGATFSPVQVQKLMFLVDRRIPAEVGGPLFDFQPYHYGPYDRAVYVELERLASDHGLVEVVPQRGWRSYRLTPAGQVAGRAAFGRLNDRARDFLGRASTFVRTLTFSQLVSAIYKDFPEMRERSVFNG